MGNFEFVKEQHTPLPLHFSCQNIFVVMYAWWLEMVLNFYLISFFFITCMKYYLNIWSEINGRLDNTLKCKNTKNICNLFDTHLYFCLNCLDVFITCSLVFFYAFSTLQWDVVMQLDTSYQYLNKTYSLVYEAISKVDYSDILYKWKLNKNIYLCTSYLKAFTLHVSN